MTDRIIIENSSQPKLSSIGTNPVQQIKFGSRESLGQLSLDTARKTVILTVHQTGQEIYRHNSRFTIGDYKGSRYRHHGDSTPLDGANNGHDVAFITLCAAIGANPSRVMNLCHKLVDRWMREHPPKTGISNTQRKKLRHKNAVAKRKRQQRHKRIKGL